MISCFCAYHFPRSILMLHSHSLILKSSNSFKYLTNIIIYCGGSVASSPHFSGALNYAHAQSNVWTNSRHVQNICHKLHNGTVVRRYGCVDDVSSPIYHRMHGHRISRRMVVLQYVYGHAISNFPLIAHIFHKMDKQIYCKRKVNGK